MEEKKSVEIIIPAQKIEDADSCIRDNSCPDWKR